jgi:hypothetical protein
MPLIEIAALPQPAGIDTATVTRELNRAVADALGARLDAVWTVWRTIDGPYAQGDDVATEQPKATHGPIVHVYHHRTPEQVARVVEVIERVLALALDLAPGSVFVTVQPVEIVGRTE